MQVICAIASVKCKNLLNFTCITIELYDCAYATAQLQREVFLFRVFLGQKVGHNTGLQSPEGLKGCPPIFGLMQDKSIGRPPFFVTRNPKKIEPPQFEKHYQALVTYHLVKDKWAFRSLFSCIMNIGSTSYRLELVKDQILGWFWQLEKFEKQVELHL